MAHRLLWRSNSDDKVAIFERGSQKRKGNWQSTVVNTEVGMSGERVNIKGESELRTYLIREWLSKVECRATLESIVYIYKETRHEDS